MTTKAQTFRISEPSGGPRRCGKNPRAGPDASASSETGARSRRQSLQETISRRFCPAPAEQALALSQSRSLILPTPNLSWGFTGDRPGMVEVDAISRELLNSSSESNGPSFRAPGNGFFGCQLLSQKQVLRTQVSALLTSLLSLDVHKPGSPDPAAHTARMQGS